MSFADRTKHQKRLMVAGMACLAISGLLQMPIHPTTRLGTDWLDGTRGLFLGMSLALNIAWLRLSRRDSNRDCALRD